MRSGRESETEGRRGGRGGEGEEGEGEGEFGKVGEEGKGRLVRRRGQGEKVRE